jgi:hypothetical protein
VFYIGKGQGSRIRAHEREAQGACCCPKCERIRCVWAAGEEIKRTIVFETDSESAALQYERDLIATIGRVNLCNRSDGGEPGSVPVGLISIRALRKQLNAEARRRLETTPLEDYWNRKFQLKEWIKREIERAIESRRQHEELAEKARAIATIERISVRRLLRGAPKRGATLLFRDKPLPK